MFSYGSNRVNSASVRTDSVNIGSTRPTDQRRSTDQRWSNSVARPGKDLIDAKFLII
ncbi:hypothetical protein HanIR_Chr07g0300571 [Helianthus annuus]|nr:hypothetical protein HanIR_Chr07g0300571 [Helianthus annuus]